MLLRCVFLGNSCVNRTHELGSSAGDKYNNILFISYRSNVFVFGGDSLSIEAHFNDHVRVGIRVGVGVRELLFILELQVRFDALQLVHIGHLIATARGNGFGHIPQCFAADLIDGAAVVHEILDAILQYGRGNNAVAIQGQTLVEILYSRIQIAQQRVYKPN